MGHFSKLAAVAAAMLLAACSPRAPETVEAAAQAPGAAPIAVSFEKFELANGLEVVLHVDDSVPALAIDLAAHVGSAREVPGRTGFAHLFEHLLFLDSENLGYGGLDELNSRIGGTTVNGFTTNDMTQYYQTAPADALEKIIWAEAEKLGFFIKTVTEEALANEKQVVENEKRQGVDNRPYGHLRTIVAEALYPPDHPYSWTVIGSLEDIDAASLGDVRAFRVHDDFLGGSFTSDLDSELRVAKGYTYGIRSRFAGAPDRGTFSVAASVRSNVTLESLVLIRDIVERYGPTFDEARIEALKASLLRRQALASQTQAAKLELLERIVAWDRPLDYRTRDVARLAALTLEEISRLAERHLRA